MISFSQIKFPLLGRSVAEDYFIHWSQIIPPSLDFVFKKAFTPWRITRHKMVAYLLKKYFLACKWPSLPRNTLRVNAPLKRLQTEAFYAVSCCVAVKQKYFQ